MLNLERFIATAGYGIIALASAVVFGNLGEACDIVDVGCPSRLKWLISCGVISTIIALPAMLISLLVRDLSKFIHMALFGALFLLWVAGAAVAASYRTFIAVGMENSAYSTIPPGFSFLALFAAFLMMLYYAFRVVEGMGSGAKDVRHDSPMSPIGSHVSSGANVPMHPSGQPGASPV